MTAGLCTRLATLATFGVVVHNLFLSTTNMHNNRAYLLIVLRISPPRRAGREFSVDAAMQTSALPPADTNGPAWLLLLLRFEACVVYGASGWSGCST